MTVWGWREKKKAHEDHLRDLDAAWKKENAHTWWPELKGEREKVMKEIEAEKAAQMYTSLIGCFAQTLTEAEQNVKRLTREVQDRDAVIESKNESIRYNVQLIDQLRRELEAQRVKKVSHKKSYAVQIHELRRVVDEDGAVVSLETRDVTDSAIGNNYFVAKRVSEIKQYLRG